MAPQPSSPQAAAAAFAAIVGEAHACADEETRLEFSQDLFAWAGPVLVDLVARPGNASEVAGILRLAASLGYAVAPRGAGLSYTRGYVPQQARTVALDLTRMNRILECNEADLYLVAEAGATWQQAHDAARGKGLRLALQGPISGIASTLGGAASQNTLGSLHAFLGFEVVLPDGSIVRTGSGAKTRARSPFTRHFGPDVTGLFIGDTGTFGVKTEVTLQLEPLPAGLAMASFSFAAAPALAGAMAELARRGLVRRMIGMDPIKTRGASKVGLAEAGRTLRAIATSGRTLREGLADAAAVARSGRQALDQAEWALHLQVDGFDRAAADRQLEAARRICLQDGQEISPNVAIALNARPYSIRGMLGLQGERWVPIHGIFPLSQAAAAAARVQAFLDARTDLLERHGIGHCCCMFTEGPAFAIEPMFYWRDEIGPLHRRHLDARNYARFKDAAPEPDVRAAVRGLRDELKGLFFELGAVHGQIGKFYDFAGAVEPGLFDLLTRLKRALDPDGRLNPGNFGWSAAETRP